MNEKQQLPHSQHLAFPPAMPADDEIDLRELFGALWKGKWIIIATTFIFAVGGVLFALSQPNTYKAEVVLAPAGEGSGGGGLAAMAGQLGGLASLAGINIGGGGTDSKAMSLATLQSRQFINVFITKHDLLVPLLASTEWNEGSGELIIDPELYNTETKQWVEWLVADFNLWMKDKPLTETKRNIGYLEQQLQKADISDMRSVFYQLIEDQTKNLMLAEVESEFAFKTIDPAVIPEEKAGPKRALICVLATLLGGMLGVAVVLVRFAFRKEETESETRN